MSTEKVWKLFVKTVAGEWVQVGPSFSGWFPFMYEDSLEEAKAHYQRLGLKTKTEDSMMEFDNR